MVYGVWCNGVWCNGALCIVYSENPPTAAPLMKYIHSYNNLYQMVLNRFLT